MIAAIYARKSTEQFGVTDDQKSVARQVEAARAYAARKGWLVLDEHVYVDDGISGAEFVKRPGLAKLLAALKPRPPFQVLIMSEESRLAREQIEGAYIMKQILDTGVQIFLYLEDRQRTLDTPVEKMLLSLVGFSDEMERDKARQRTKDALVRKAQLGHVTGGRVYGYDNVPIVVPGPDGRPVRQGVVRKINETQAAVVRRIFEFCAQGFGLTRTAKMLNAQGVSPPRAHGRGWAPTAVREILHRELYRGEVVWNRSQKIHRRGTKAQRRRNPEEWLRRSAPELRIVPDTVWDAAHARLQRTRNTFRPTAGAPSRLDSPSPYLLSGLGRCTCGGSLIALSRHHGRRRGFFYGCAYNSKRGPHVCPNNLHLPQPVLEQAVIDAVVEALDQRIVRSAADRALQRFREEAKAYGERRRQLEQELRAAEAHAAHLIAAIKQGDAPAPLLDALREQQQQRSGLTAALQTLTELEHDAALDEARLVDELAEAATKFRISFSKRTPEARRVLQALLPDRLQFSVFECEGVRGYEFVGTGTYGGLLAGYTSPTSGRGPNGTRTLR